MQFSVKRGYERIASKLECAKEKYKGLSLNDKILDIIVAFAIILGVVLVLLEIYVGFDNSLVHILRILDEVLIIAFLADLGRGYMKLKDWGLFARRYWIDVVIVLMIVFGMSTFVYPAIGRIAHLLKAEKIATVTRFYHLKRFD